MTITSKQRRLLARALAEHLARKRTGQDMKGLANQVGIRKEILDQWIQELKDEHILNENGNLKFYA